MKKWFFVSLLLFQSRAYALDEGAAFLDIGSGARAAALSGAFTAVGDDLDDAYWNPAGLAGMDKSELGFEYSDWLLDMKHQSLSGVFPMKRGVSGFQFIRLSQPPLERRGADRVYEGNFQSYSQSLGLLFSRKVSGSLTGGVKFQFIQSKLDADKAATVALDFGSLYRAEGSPLSFGLTVKNVGRGLKYIDQRDGLPLTVSFGGLYAPHTGLNLSLDIKRRIYSCRTILSVGGEYSVMPSLSLRGGYMTEQGPAGTESQLSGFSAGLGFSFLNYEMDYAFSPAGEFGDVHIFSLKAKI